MFILRSKKWRNAPLRSLLFAFIASALLPTHYGFSQSEQIRQIFQRGATAMHNGQTAEAEAAFREAVRLAPDMPEAHLDLGLVLGREGKIEEAITSIRRALTLNPDLPSAHMFLGIFLYQSNQGVEAQKELEAEVARSPDNVEALSWLGTVLLAQQQPERAVVPLDHAAQLDPNNLNVLELRGRAHSQVATDSFARMTKIDPGSWHVHRLQGELYADQRKHSEAIGEYQAAIKLQERNPDLYEALGDEYRITNQYAAAEEAYRKGLSLGPTNPIALYNLGSILVERGDAAQGIPLLEKMLQIYPNAPLAEYYMGRGLSQAGKNEQAITWLKKSAAGNQDDEVTKRSLYELARVYRKLNRTAEADATLKTLKQLRGETAGTESEPSSDDGSWKKLSGGAPSSSPPSPAPRE